MITTRQSKRDKFFDVMKNIFIGAQIEGNSGYVNLMRIKSKYYNEFKTKLNKDISAKLSEVGYNFEEEFFNKLYTFFNKYFSESGSIYFSYTPLQEKVYERVYRDDKDVMLFWKTNMLYYVKTERLFKDMEIIDDDTGIKFCFDVSQLELKKNNEKKELVFEIKDAFYNSYKDAQIHFYVKYSQSGSKTKIDDILKVVKKAGDFKYRANEKLLERAFSIFKKQSEVDFFINKNARDFLREQFLIYIKNYLVDDDTIFEEKRLKQMKALKDAAFNIIELVSQFEDELVKIWNKPKFSYNSNYVISIKTLKKLVNLNYYEKFLNQIIEQVNNNEELRNDLVEVVREILKLPLQKIYVKDVSLKKDRFTVNYVKYFKDKEKRLLFAKQNNIPIPNKTEDVNTNDKISGYPIEFDRVSLTKEVLIEDLYIDTKYFDDIFKTELIEAISSNNNLSDVIDGYLIKSDNYQAINTLKLKYQDKVDLIYIDPPFNTSSVGFSYIDNFKDSTWLTMLENRYSISKFLLSKSANYYIHLDHNCNYLGRLLINNIDPTVLRREIIWNTSPSPSGLKSVAPNWIRQHDTIFYLTYNDKPKFNKLWRVNIDLLKGKKEEENEEENIGVNQSSCKKLGWQDIYIDKDKCFILKYDSNNNLNYKEIESLPLLSIGDVWNDIYSMMYTQNMTRENWGNSNTQKPENLLRRIIQSSTEKKDLVLDFFLGTGTTIAAAHKMGRKWIGIEMGDFIETVVLKRMKTVIVGDKKPKLTIDLNWQGGGFFKYFSLEQYEEVLNKVKYEDKNAMPVKDIYSQYLFLKDLKLADEVIKLDDESTSIKVDLTKLHKNIDIPETLSHLLGKFIKQIKQDEVLFTDGTKIDLNNIDYKIIKPLIWW